MPETTAFARCGRAGIWAPSQREGVSPDLGHREDQLRLRQLLGQDDRRLAVKVLDHDGAVALDLALRVELDRPAERDPIGRGDVRLADRLGERLAIRALRALERVGGDQDRVEGVGRVDAVKRELVLREALLERRPERAGDLVLGIEPDRVRDAVRPRTCRGPWRTAPRRGRASRGSPRPSGSSAASPSRAAARSRRSAGRPAAGAPRSSPSPSTPRRSGPWPPDRRGWCRAA